MKWASPNSSARATMRARSQCVGVGRPECLGYLAGARVLEEEPGLVLDDGVEVAAGAQGNGRYAEGRRLEGSQPEVLVAGRDEHTRVGVGPPQLRVAEPREQAHVGRKLLAQPCCLRTVTDHDERSPGVADGLDHGVDVLVGHQPRHDQGIAGVEVGELLDRLLRGSRVHAVRRRQQLRGAAIGVGDPALHHPTVGEVDVDRRRLPGVPPAQARAHRHQRRPERVAPGRSSEVLVGLVEPAGRVVAVDDLVAGGHEAVRPAAAGGDGDVGVDRPCCRPRGPGQAARGGGRGGSARSGSSGG